MSAGAPALRRPLRVLYLHGLESRLWGKKSLVLRDEVHAEVHGVQMRVKELRTPWGENAAMSAFSLLCMCFLACTGVGGFLAAAPLREYLTKPAVSAIVAACFAAATLFAGASLFALQAALQFVVETCYEQQREALHAFRPDVVIGSSFGGAMAQLLLARGQWAGPTLLLAPAGQLVARWYSLAWELASCTCCCGRPVYHADRAGLAGAPDAAAGTPRLAARLTAAQHADGQAALVSLPPQRPSEALAPARPAPLAPSEPSASGDGLRNRASTPPSAADGGSTTSPPVPILIVHAVEDGTVPLHDSLVYATVAPSWATVHVLPVHGDAHPLRVAATASAFTAWLNALDVAWAEGGSVEGLPEEITVASPPPNT